MSKEILTLQEKVYKIENMILDFYKSEDENLTNLAYDIYNFMTESEREGNSFINFAKEVIMYYEKYDIGDVDLYNKAKTLFSTTK